MEFRPPASFGSLIGELTFSRNGVLPVVAGTVRYYAANTMKILGVRASVGTAPVGSGVIVDVNRNGVTAYTTQANRPTIPAAAFVSPETAPNVIALVAGDYLTVDIDQIGSGTAGSDLLVVIRYSLA